MALTDLSFLDTGRPWPPPGESERLRKYADNKLLFESKHELVFVENFRRLLREEDKTAFEIVLNWPKRISTLWADLLFGEAPSFSAGKSDGDEQAALDRIVRRNELIILGYEAALDMSRYGEAIMKIRFDAHGRIELVPPNIWFPVVSPDNIKETTHHVLAWTVNVGGDAKNRRLRVEIHEPGKITHRTYAMSESAIGIMQEEREEEFALDEFLVRPVPNMGTSDSVYGFDDYEDIAPVVSEIEVRVAQISRILDKHADPSMYGDEAALEEDPMTGETSVRGGSKFFPVSQNGVTPGYLTWDGGLDAAFKQVEVLMEQFYAVSETSPAAFGQLKAGLAESGTALKRLLIAPLAKVNRLRMRLDPALKHVVSIVSRLEKAQGMSKAVDLEPDVISITWEDGLPDDEREETEMANARVAAGTLSRESAVKRLDRLDGEALQDEMERIDAERASAFGPTPMLGRFDFGGGGGVDDDDDLDLGA